MRKFAKTESFFVWLNYKQPIRFVLTFELNQSNYKTRFKNLNHLKTKRKINRILERNSKYRPEFYHWKFEKSFARKDLKFGTSFVSKSPQLFLHKISQPFAVNLISKIDFHQRRRKGLFGEINDMFNLFGWSNLSIKVFQSALDWLTQFDHF